MATTPAAIAQIENGRVPVTDLVVRNQRDNQRALRRVAELMSYQHRTAAENALLDVLSNAIEAYEGRRYARPSSTPAELILFLLKQKGQTAQDLDGILGGKSHTSEILHDRRPIGTKNAVRLGKHFNISPAAFVTFR
jgi:antitoxin component HigA of HigAB toxin-antitoxin module